MQTSNTEQETSSFYQSDKQCENNNNADTSHKGIVDLETIADSRMKRITPLIMVHHLDQLNRLSIIKVVAMVSKTSHPDHNNSNMDGDNIIRHNKTTLNKEVRLVLRKEVLDHRLTEIEVDMIH